MNWSEGALIGRADPRLEARVTRRCEVKSAAGDMARRPRGSSDADWEAFEPAIVVLQAQEPAAARPVAEDDAFAWLFVDLQRVTCGAMRVAVDQSLYAVKLHLAQNFLGRDVDNVVCFHAHLVAAFVAQFAG